MRLAVSLLPPSQVTGVEKLGKKRESEDQRGQEKRQRNFGVPGVLSLGQCKAGY